MIDFCSSFKNIFLRPFVLLSLFSFGGIAQSQVITVFDINNSGLPDNTVRVIARADDALWVGTDWGLARLENNIWTNYNSSNAGLPDNSIRSIAIDEEGKIWAGTFLGGLAILQNDTVETVYNTINSPLPDDQVRAIAFDSAGVWIGTTGGLAYKRDTTWQVYKMSNSILRSNNIASILIDHLHRVWVGTVNGGLVMMEDTSWTLYRNDNSGLLDNTVLDLAIDESENIWIASPAGGVTAFDGSTWLNFNTSNSNSPTNSYNGIVIVNEVKYLSSFTNGLVIYRGGIVWENYDTVNSDMPQNDLLCIEAGDSGCVWLGTLSSGLVKFCEADSSVSVALQEYPKISLFPMPASSLLNIHFSGLAQITEATVYDLAGRRLLTDKSINSDSFEIPLTGFNNGIFFLEIVSSKGKQVVRFVKQSG